MKTEHVQILPGVNHWLVARTDRDCVERDEARSSALIVLRRWLQLSSPVSMRSVYVEHAGQIYAIGAARPLTIAVASSRPALKPERVETVQRFEDCRILRTLNTRDPWWLTVNFVWRAGPVRALWPRSSVNAIGVEDDNDQALDWLLVEAAHDATQKVTEDKWHKSA
jgi:hypothetical protein